MSVVAGVVTRPVKDALPPTAVMNTLVVVEATDASYACKDRVWWWDEGW